MDVVTCPQCGQMQMLNQEKKCIKCGSDLTAYDDRPAEKPFGPFYVCPSCRNIQEGEKEKCEKCGHDMKASNGGFLFIAVVLCVVCVFLLLELAKQISHVQFCIEHGFSYDQNGVVMAACMLALCVVFCIIFFVQGKTSKSYIKKDYMKEYVFCAIDGLPEVNFETKGKMEFDTDSHKIVFSFGESLVRSLSFSQIIGISWGNYNYMERQKFVGGVSVGNVFIHETPSMQKKTKPYFQLKYRPSAYGTQPQIIRIVFYSADHIKELEDITSIIGFKLDEECIVERIKQL